MLQESVIIERSISSGIENILCSMKSIELSRLFDLAARGSSELGDSMPFREENGPEAPAG